MSDNTPIFIIGMPRSGTTLLSSMLSAHSRIAISPETHFLSLYVHKFRHDELTSREMFEEFWRTFIAGDRFGNMCLDAALCHDCIVAAGDWTYRGVFEVLLSAYARSLNKPRWGEKTPDHYQHLDRLMQWYPQAQVIFMLRDPRAVSASLQKTDWGGNDVVTHTRRWRNAIVAYESHKAGGRIHLIKYADLVAEPEQTCRRVCELIGEQFESGMLTNRGAESQPQLARRQGWAREQIEQAQQPIHTQSIDAWRNQMPRRQVALIETEVYDLMKQYGFEPDLGRPGPLRRLALIWNRVQRRFHAPPRRTQEAAH
ncbi:MAG: hypothetical protein GC162_18080 [Planctomycetes bacterium]|nr:hypothetical protein [Planctomycetota bacterium]